MNIRERLKEYKLIWEWLPGKLQFMLESNFYGCNTLSNTARLELHKMRDIDPDDLTPAEIDFMNRFSDLDF